MFSGKHISFEGATFGGERTNGFDGATFVGDRAPGMEARALWWAPCLALPRFAAMSSANYQTVAYMGKIVGRPYHLSSTSYIYHHSQSIHPSPQVRATPAMPVRNAYAACSARVDNRSRSPQHRTRLPRRRTAGHGAGNAATTRTRRLPITRTAKSPVVICETCLLAATQTPPTMLSRPRRCVEAVAAAAKYRQTPTAARSFTNCCSPGARPASGQRDRPRRQTSSVLLALLGPVALRVKAARVFRSSLHCSCSIRPRFSPAWHLSYLSSLMGFTASRYDSQVAAPAPQNASRSASGAGARR